MVREGDVVQIVISVVGVECAPASETDDAPKWSLDGGVAEIDLGRFHLSLCARYACLREFIGRDRIVARHSDVGECHRYEGRPAMKANPFIDRPVFAAVIAIVFVLAGVVAMRVLPAEQYPQIVPPQVVVQATYPGASAETVAQTVAAPLEQQINGVENMLYM